MDDVIAVIGLGYVGLPLAVACDSKYTTIGFDIKKERIEELKKNIDRTEECDVKTLKNVTITFSFTLRDIEKANIFIVTVPTPVDSNKRPDLTLLLNATQMVGSVLKKGDIVIYESTVFPGATEEICAPLLEKESGLIFNEDFFCGYSPERINPGDREHSIERIVKITSGSTADAAKKIDTLYKNIITIGTYPASSIKVAEAAKVIENSQRDINIAFVNELAIICNRLNIDTGDVLAAAQTKWNFLPFQPGLVGGHCIGVDPYYLTHKAQECGYHPEIILAGRRLNDTMALYVAGRVVKGMIQKGIKVNNARVLILGITFKENCPDVRNSQVINLIHELEGYSCQVDVHDSRADYNEVKKMYNIDLIREIDKDMFVQYNAIILAVSHNEYKALDASLLKDDNRMVYDVKGFFDKKYYDERL